MYLDSVDSVFGISTLHFFSKVSGMESRKEPTIIKAKSVRFAAMQLDIGNIVSMLIPMPLAVFWFGGSILIYALHRHHPDPRVGQFTQWAAYRFYAVMGVIIPVGTFFPGDGWMPWLIAWAIGVVIIVPWSIWSLIRVKNTDWKDIEVPAEDEEFDDVED